MTTWSNPNTPSVLYTMLHCSAEYAQCVKFDVLLTMIKENIAQSSQPEVREHLGVHQFVVGVRINIYVIMAN